MTMRDPCSRFGKSHYGIFMVSLMPLFMVFVSIAYVFTLMKMVTAALDAPLGYEDEDGFHYGVQPVPVRRN